MGVANYAKQALSDASVGISSVPDALCRHSWSNSPIVCEPLPWMVPDRCVVTGPDKRWACTSLNSARFGARTSCLGSDITFEWYRVWELLWCLTFYSGWHAGGPIHIHSALSATVFAATVEVPPTWLARNQFASFGVPITSSNHVYAAMSSDVSRAGYGPRIRTELRAAHQQNWWHVTT